MLNGAFGNSKSNSLMSEYSSLLGDAVLRHRARVAEHSARIETELASKVKSEFIANMSHELRTPLNTVIGFSKLLSEHDKRRPLPDNEIVEYATLIHDAAGHLLAVINDILDISKIQSGRYTLDAARSTSRRSCRPCIASFRRWRSEAGVALDPARRRRPADGQGRRGQAAAGLHQPDLQRHQVHAARRHGHDRGAAPNDGGVAVLVRDTGRRHDARRRSPSR